MRYGRIVTLALSMGLAAGMVGCETKAGTGTAVGAVGGAALGAIIGHQSGHAGTGALIGGAVGAGGGYIAGNEMDKADARREASRREAYDRPPVRDAVQPVSKQDVINWTMRNTTDEVIIQRIRSSGTVFHLTAQDEQELRDNGVSPRVIDAMRQTAR